jgi:FtsP/CotA-like multicopper oxidase with cupredoxin domain
MSSSSVITRRPHRVIALAGAAVLAIVILLVTGQTAGHATSGGNPYAVPLVTDTNPAPNIVETTLTAEDADVDIGNGVIAHAQTFNGAIPGPTFELNVGDHVIVHYENHLDRPSAIHWHGIELANEMDGTPFTQNMVEPGGGYLYEWTANRPGLYWYHPHHHSSTDQVFKGLYGMIIVKDPNEDALQASGTLPSDAQTVPLVLSDITVCKAPGSNDTHTYDDNTDGTPLVTQPWAGGGGAANQLPAQLAPVPKNLCEGPAVASMGGGSDPYPVDEDGVLRSPFAAGDIPNIQTANANGRINEGQTVLTNGKNVGARSGAPLSDQPGGAGTLAAGAATLNVQPGQGIRLEILNASAVRYMRLQLTTATGAMVPLFKVGGEGGLLDSAVEDGGTQGSWPTGFDLGEVLVPPGSRYDVVAAIPPAPTTGVLTLWTRDYSRTGNGMVRIPTVPVMHLNLAGSTVTPNYTIASGKQLRSATGDLVPTLGAATGALLNPATFTPPKTGMASQTIALTAQMNTQLGIDGVFGTHDVPAGTDYTAAAHLGSTRYAKVGDTLELSVTNNTGANHPFHLHGFSIQPLKLDAAPLGPGGNDFTWPYHEFRDNVDIPPGYTLIFRVKLDARPMPDGTTPGGELGRWLFHCHIFFHATNGMLSELVITQNASGNERPDINADAPAVTADQGASATMTGTYSDRDGDAVSLAASVGTVTDTGGGHWSWTYPTSGDESSKAVYVTATDTPGNKGQAAFDLNVNQKAPTIDSLKLDPKKFRPGKQSVTRPTAKKPPKGSEIVFNLSKPSSVAFTVKKLKPKKPKVSEKTFSRDLTAGAQKVDFSAKFGKKKLPKGKYQLTATATDAGGLKSSDATTKFKIVSSHKHHGGHGHHH